MPITKIIGVTGYKRSGKDQFCTFLKQFSKTPIVRHAFADDIREEIYEHVFQPNGLQRELLFDDSKKDIYRPIFIWWGTEFRRYHFGNDYWINKMSDRIHKVHDQKDNGDCIFCVSDVRLLEEVKFIREYNGIIVKVDRFDTATLDHPTETEISQIVPNYVVKNRGTLEEYCFEVGKFAELLKLK